jgi:tetratricopeptide (TPR) repeat protein
MPKPRIRIKNYLFFILIAGAGAFSYFYSQEVYSWYLRTYYEKIRGLSVERQIRKAEKMYGDHEYEELRDYLKPLIMAYPENRELKKLDGLSLIKLGGLREGAEMILTATEGGRMPEKLLLETTSALFEKKMYRDITNLFKKNTAGGNPGLLYMHGVSLYETGHYPQSIASLKRALESGKTGFETNRYIGLAYDKTGDTRASLPYLKRAHELNDEDPGAALSLANAYRKLGRYNDAERIMRKIKR